VERINLIARDRPGLLAEITGLLAENGISITSIVADSYGNDGVLHIDLEETDRALGVLAAAGYQAAAEGVLLARIADRPGALAHLSRRLMDANVAIRALNMVQRDDGWAVVAISTSDNESARTVLGDDLISR
jgi:hypothetical protein